MATLAPLAQLSDAVAGERGRRAKIERLAGHLGSLRPEEAGLAACLLAGELPQGRIGVGPAQIAQALSAPPATHANLTLEDLERTLAAYAGISGSGARAGRQSALAGLFARATPPEQGFMARLLLGELRQGATAGLVLEAIALAARVPAGTVRRALMLCGDLSRVAALALREGAPGLAAVGLTLFRPIQPMLAEPAEGLDQALERLHAPVLEYKLDGARIQVHKRGTEVRVFSRQGNEVTAAVPEIPELIAPLPVPDLVLDGEVLALRPDGRPLPFQTTMRRFGRRLEVERLREELPLTPFFFDCLQQGGTLLIDAPARERFLALAEALPSRCVIPRLHPRNADEAGAFLAQALGEGHEGLMAKDPESPYQAGGRGASWLKIKATQTLDLVVLAAEWGSGRRSAWLSNLHLGARDGAGGFVMLGKTFKGLTDELLAWQTERLLVLALAPGDPRRNPLVRVRPELVVEIAFNELQESPRYPAGLALRFARVKRYRPDKSPAEADDLATVRALFARQVAYAGRHGGGAASSDPGPRT
ncbi:MAG: ATP-dependent DNA ligase [Bdellovibrio bacteriovorus]